MSFHWTSLGSGGSAARLPVDRRAEARLESAGHRASVIFRSKEYRLAVVNISARGAMVEWATEPRLGESVVIRFEGCTPVMAFVRWVRDGQVGLAFGHEIILC